MHLVKQLAVSTTCIHVMGDTAPALSHVSLFSTKYEPATYSFCHLGRV